ncbi:MAG: helix-turn-helix domain-containing protein [Gemmataceae bacterium]
MSDEDLALRLGRIEEMLTTLVEQRAVKDWYTVGEFSAIVKKAEFTIREYCRGGRIRAKKASGRGRGSGEWLISHEELQRFRNEGPLPLPAQGVRV